MSWIFSQAMMTAHANSPSSLAAEEASSADTSTDGEPFAQLNVMPSPRPFWRNDKTMDVLKRSPFGLTWRPLTATRGEELLTSFRAGFHVPTSHAPAKEQASKAKNPAYGESLPASLAKYDPATSSWKTPQCSLFADSEPFSVTWPAWGTMRNGVAYQRPTPSGLNAFRAMITRHLTTSASESGSSLRAPTPRAAESTETQQARMARGTKASKNMTSFARAPTPRACEADHPPYGPRGNGLQQWMTSEDSQRSGGQMPQRYPTPSANEDAAGLPTGNMQRMLGNCPEIRNSDPAGGQLNPTWEDWFMGWPIGWTDVRHSAMARFQQWCDSHGTPSQEQPNE